MISYLSYRLGARLARALPERTARVLTGAISRSQYLLRRDSRETVRSNLRIVTGGRASDREVDALAKNVFSNFGRSIYCFLRIGASAPDGLLARCDYAGLDAAAAGLHKNGGFVVAGPHVGPWELGGLFVSALGIRVHTVALDHPSRRVTRFFEERRRSAGILCHPFGGAFSTLRGALEAGSCVALLIDRAHGRGGSRYALFGRDVVLPTGHAALAVRCGVPVLTAVCVFAPDDRFTFAFGGPHYPDPALDEEDRMEQLHRRCRDDMERFIREYPDQWFNFRRLENAGND